jgi:hypothetical protein
MVIGALVVLAMTYLGGVASIGGALVAGLLAQAGVITTLSADLSGGEVGQYVFATSGIALILTAIFAPDGLTGLLRRRPRPATDADGGPEGPAIPAAAATGVAAGDEGLDRPAGANA